MKKSYIYLGVIALVSIFGVGIYVYGYSGQAKYVVEGDMYLNEDADDLGGFFSPDIIGVEARTEVINQAGATSTVILNSTNSGNTYFLTGSSTEITLPAVFDGANFRFQISGASSGYNWIIDSSEGDNIEGTLIVAGAVVDCAAEDQINFVVDGENVGDYVELMSDGTNWFIGDSGVLTAAKMTCTDPS